jgi:hypothetical protein
MNFPIKFGFEPDLRACVGKTIERVELMKMEWGCTWQNAFAVRFTDGSRAFFAGHVGTGIMNPELEGAAYHSETVETSHIFTKREYAEMMGAKERNEEQRKKRYERAEREQFEKLAQKFGEKV